MELKDKVAVITGGSKGIGYALCVALLEKGMKVVNWSRSSAEIDHHNFFEVTVDVGDFESVFSGYEKTQKMVGDKIHVLINNAGLGYYHLLEETSLEQWHQMFDVNVNGIFYTCKKIVPLMKQQREGHIINIASIAATNAVKGMSGYCGTKHAVRGITHSLFAEMRDFGVKVSCIYPGSVETEFFNNTPDLNLSENMLKADDLALSIVQILEAPQNHLHLDVEIRPLQPHLKA